MIDKNFACEMKRVRQRKSARCTRLRRVIVYYEKRVLQIGIVFNDVMTSYAFWPKKNYAFWRKKFML